MNLIDLKDVVIEGRAFVLSKIPAIPAREIVSVYLSSSLPKIGNYQINEEIMYKLMKYVGVRLNETVIPLITPDLINNHTGDWETLMKVEWAMVEYNSRFLQNGRVSTFLNDTAQNIPRWIIKILTVLSAQSSQMEKPPSTS
jgi:hypothetical protein